jgi:hypothetical protein
MKYPATTELATRTTTWVPRRMTDRPQAGLSYAPSVGRTVVARQSSPHRDEPETSSEGSDEFGARAALAHHLVHHRGKLDGVPQTFTSRR